MKPIDPETLQPAKSTEPILITEITPAVLRLIEAARAVIRSAVANRARKQP